MVSQERKEVKVRLAKNAHIAKFFLGPVGKVLIASGLLRTIGCLGVFTYYYSKYSRVIDQKLKAGPFANTSKIFAAPKPVFMGDQIAIADIVSELRRAGYSESRSNPMGSYHVRPDAIEVFPGPESYFDREDGVIKFSNGRVSQIVS